MDSAGNIFGYCIGALSDQWSFSKQLDELLLETKNIYYKANNERILVPDVSTEAQKRLSMSVYIFHVQCIS